jgi:hypothetical protein
MSLFRCRECDHEISTEARQCPHCGAPVDTEFPKQRHPVRLKRRHLFWGSFLTIVGVLVVLTILYKNYGLGKEQVHSLIHWCRTMYQSHR